MRSIVPILALLFSVGAAPGATEPPLPAPNTFHSALPATQHVWIALLRLRFDIFAHIKAGDHQPLDAATDKALEDHARYWGDQLKQGHTLIAGAMGGEYWDNAAVIVFDAPTRDAAEALVAADPAVRAYVFQAQVRPFDLFWLTDRYDSRFRAQNTGKPATAPQSH